MNARMMHLNLFVFGCGHHRGAWRHPNSSVERLGDIRYYEQLAQTAERGKLDAVFFGFCRKVRFLGQNPKIGCQEFNNLQTHKLSKKQLCDRTRIRAY